MCVSVLSIDWLIDWLIDRSTLIHLTFFRFRLSKCHSSIPSCLFESAWSLPRDVYCSAHPALEKLSWLVQLRVSWTVNFWRYRLALSFLWSFSRRLLLSVMCSVFWILFFVFQISGSVQRHRGQVHWRKCPDDSWDVSVRQGPSAMYHLHGRDWRDRRAAFLGGNVRGSWDPAYTYGSTFFST